MGGVNRPYESYPGQRAVGGILIDGDTVLDGRQGAVRRRARIGMVFQRPTPFPKSIHDNVAFGVTLYERLWRSEMGDRCSPQ